MYCGIYA